MSDRVREARAAVEDGVIDYADGAATLEAVKMRIDAYRDALLDAVAARVGERTYVAVRQGLDKDKQPVVEMRYHDPKRHKTEPKVLWLPEILATITAMKGEAK